MPPFQRKFLPYRAPFDGPSAQLEIEIKIAMILCTDPEEADSLRFELEKLWRKSKQPGLSEEDAEWAAWRSEKRGGGDNTVTWIVRGRYAYDVFLEKSGGLIDGKPSTWETAHPEAWFAFAERTWTGPAEEIEDEIIRGGVEAYARVAGLPVPPLSEPWIAASRAIRSGEESDVRERLAIVFGFKHKGLLPPRT